jgi:hypothetical protein
MNRTAIIFGILGTLTVSAWAGGNPKYPVSEIPEELKVNVNAVYREDKTVFKILQKDRATYYVHEVITILNEKGKHFAHRSIDYDKLLKIIDLNGYTYDALGKQVKKLRNSEIYDRAAFDGLTLFSDNRVKEIDLSQNSYPYTVEFEYEMEFKYLYSIPPSFFGGTEYSVVQGSYQLIFPKELAPRYVAINMGDKPKQGVEEGMESLTWTISNVKPLMFEKFGPPHTELIPHVEAAPSVFEYEGYLGNMSSWLEYGKWNLLLGKGRDVLPEATKLKIRELTRDMKTVEEKAKAVYSYVQSKTRYVNISLGIGGLQPFPASVVDENSYGDCKALSNYTMALLKEAGVKGYYTVIQAGPDAQAVKTDFPSHQFNHVVVAVPNKTDTLWLECTSQTNPFGYQGLFTEDRWALMLTEEGGKLVRTINYKPEQNTQTRNAEVAIDANGNARAKVRTITSGIQYENDGLDQALLNTERQKKWIEENVDIPNFNINSFAMKNIKNKIPSAIVTMDLTLSRYASVSGKRMFITPNLMNRSGGVLEKIAERKTDVVRKSNFIDLDTIAISLPENLYPEFLPQQVKYTSRFGEYEASFKFDAGKVIYTRRLKMWKGRYPKETYNELVDFYKNINKADATKLVFLNKT